MAISNILFNILNGIGNRAEARQCLGMEYLPGAVETNGSGTVHVASWVSGASTTMQFTIYTKQWLTQINSINVTSLKIVPRGTDGYIDNFSSTATEVVGKSGFTVTASKNGTNSVNVIIKKSSALANCANNTPAVIDVQYTMTLE